MEERHSEGESPFIEAKDSLQQQQQLGAESFLDATDYIECPVVSCGEAVLTSELGSHLDMHSFEETDHSASHSHHGQPSNNLPVVLKPDSKSEEKTSNDRGQQHQTTAGWVKPPEVSAPTRQEIAKAGWRELLNMPTASLKQKDQTRGRASPRQLGVSFWQ